MKEITKDQFDKIFQLMRNIEGVCMYADISSINKWLASAKIKPEYPKLLCHKHNYGSDSEVVVLFNKPQCGMVVELTGNKNHAIYNIGEYREDWIMENFEPYDDCVIIKFN